MGIRAYRLGRRRPERRIHSTNQNPSSWNSCHLANRPDKNRLHIRRGLGSGQTHHLADLSANIYSSMDRYEL